MVAIFDKIKSIPTSKTGILSFIVYDYLIQDLCVFIFLHSKKNKVT